MKKVKLLSLTWIAALMVASSIGISANDGCVFHKTFGTEKSTIYHGNVDQDLSPCQSGTLEFISVYMRSTNEQTFGTHLNLYVENGTEKELIHTQQVVVPSVGQNPYAKIWLTENVTVDNDLDYSFEISVPDGKAITFFHPQSDSNKPQATTRGINDALAFEFGINSYGTIEPNRAGEVIVWDPNIEDAYDCTVLQKFHNETLNVPTGRSASQTFTACASGKLMDVHLNMDINNPSGIERTVGVYDVEQNTLLATATYNYSAHGGSVIASFGGAVQVDEGQVYKLLFVVENQLSLDFATIDRPDLFVGECIFGNDIIEMNMCFAVTIDETANVNDDNDDEDDSEDEDDDTVQDDYVSPYNQFTDILTERETPSTLNYSLYPNPFSTDVYIRFTSDMESAVTISLYNFMGNMVYQVQKEDIMATDEIHLQPEQDLVKGYYTVRIEYENNVVLDSILKN